MTQPEQPTHPVETLVFFVKTNKNFHQGGFVFFSREDFDNSIDALKREVTHLFESEKNKDSKVKFESWGAISSLTGELVEKFTDYPGD